MLLFILGVAGGAVTLVGIYGFLVLLATGDR